MASKLFNMPSIDSEDMSKLQKHINKEIGHYIIPTKAKNPTGKGINAKVELIDVDLYEQGARMVDRKSVV